MKSTFDIMVAGVGGQGNLVCGRILAEAAVCRNLRPVVSDTFGASRRGGAVLTHLRVGESDKGPIVPRNQADLILGLEPLETLRAAIRFGREETVVIFSELKVDTADTLGGKVEYPDIDVMTEALESISKEVFRLDPKASLEKIGTERVLNSYMIGALAGSGTGPFDSSELRQLVGETLKPKETNIAAFDAGLKRVSELMKARGV